MSKAQVKGKEVIVDGVKVADIIGSRWQSPIGPQSDFGLKFVDGSEENEPESTVALR